MKPMMSSHGLRVAIDASVGGENISDLERHLESILLWAYRIFGSEHLIRAKENYYETMGKVFPEDDFFNGRMSYFIDYFLFERTIESDASERRGTPFQLYTEENGDSIIQKVTHSVFSVYRMNDQGLIIRNIVNGDKFRIAPNQTSTFEGIERKDLFQGFLYHLENGQDLSRGLIFHPRTGHSGIKKYIKVQQKKGELEMPIALSRFARQQLHYLRHPHVSPKVFYQQDPR